MKSTNLSNLSYTNNSNTCKVVNKASRKKLLRKIEALLINVSNKLGLSYAIYQK